MEYKKTENSVIRPLDCLYMKATVVKSESILTNENGCISDCDEFDQNIYISKNDIKKNRRKSTIPQKAAAIQLDMDSLTEAKTNLHYNEEIEPVETDVNKKEQCDEYNDKLDLLYDDSLFNLDSDVLFNLKQHDIFKDIQNESDISQEIKSSSDIKDNWKEHWGIKCNMCEQVFSSKSEIDKHYTSNYNTYPVYTCAYCSKSFSKYATFRSHCYRHMADENLKCKECSKCFRHQNSLQLHMMTKHENIKPFICTECGKEFASKPGLNIHMKKHKAETKEDYPCLECGKILHTRGGLTSHMNVHRLGRRFMCDLCGKTFTQKVNMTQHVRQHTGDKPYACDKCGKTFTERSHLARHYSFHSDKRPFKCTICQKMYKTERCLKVHSLVHASERPFVCTVCNKGFLSITKLKQHSNIHTGERPFKCKYCERTFTNYPNWLKHIRRRHKVDHKTGAKLPQADKVEYKAPKATTEIKLEVDIEETVSAKNEAGPHSNQELINTNKRSQEQEVFQESVLEPRLPEDGHLIESLPLISDSLINDYNLTKAEEMFLQPGILNFPILDDRINISQQCDIFAVNTNISGNNHYVVPYTFPTGSPNQNILLTGSPSVVTVPFQLNEFMSSNFVEQSCD